MTEKPKRTLTLLFLTVFIDLVGFGMIIPLIPYLGRSLGDSAFKAGLLMSIYSLMQFIFNPFWGPLSDKYGRRPILLLSLLGAAVSHLAFAFSTTFWFMFFARLFAGTFAANISAAMAAVADISDETQRSKRMGLIGAAFGLGFTVGPFFGGFISSQGAHISTEAPFGLWTAALAASLLCFLNFIFAFFYLPETHPRFIKSALLKTVSTHISPTVYQKFAAIFQYFKKADLRSLLLTYGLNSLAMALMEVSLFLYVKDKFALTLEQASLGFAYVGLILVFTQGYLVRKMLPKYGEAKLIKSSLILFAIGVGSIPLAPTLLLFAIPVTLLSIAQGLLSPALTGSISLKEDSENQGRVMGVTQSLSALGRIIGPAIAGSIYASTLTVGPFYLSCVLSLFSLYLILKRS
jgi:multidrug resistance protein